MKQASKIRQGECTNDLHGILQKNITSVFTHFYNTVHRIKCDPVDLAVEI